MSYLHGRMLPIAIVLAADFFLLARMPQKWLAALGSLQAIGLLRIGVGDLRIPLCALGIARRLFSEDPSAEVESKFPVIAVV
jgi:hypothetical protein